jgi:DNA end-binding protein Ku
MRRSERCALAKWAWRAKQYMVQIRPAEGGMVLQQLLYADEVRSLADLGHSARRCQGAGAEARAAADRADLEAAYDPSQFVDEEKKRISPPSNARSPVSRSSGPRRPRRSAVRSST